MGWQRAEALKAFEAWDTDGSGFITREVLREVMRSLNPEFTDSALDAIFDLIDVKRSGSLRYVEFLDFLYEDGAFSEGAPSLPSDDRVWLCRQALTIADLSPLVKYCLPLFLPNAESCDIVLADAKSSLVKCCRDSIYEALDHQLLWLDHTAFDGTAILPQTAKVYLYSSPELPFTIKTDEAEVAEVSPKPCPLSFSPPEDILPLADFFDDGLDAVRARWEVRAQSEFAAKRISVEAYGVIGPPSCGTDGCMVRLDPAAGAIALVRSLPDPLDDTKTRLHVRAHFFDDGESHTTYGHWLGCKSTHGIASVGAAFGIDDCYSFLNGNLPSGKSKEYSSWQRGFDRSKGWHHFELMWENGSVNFSVDGEPLAKLDAEGKSLSTEVWLVSRCGGHGLWAGVELFYTPMAHDTWDEGVQRVKLGNRLPWNVHKCENGRWQADDSGILRSVQFEVGLIAKITPNRQCLIDSFDCVPAKYQYIPPMEPMLGNTYKVLKKNADGMVGLASLDGSNDGIWWFPPVAKAIAIVEEPVVALAPKPVTDETVADEPIEPEPIEEAPAAMPAAAVTEVEEPLPEPPEPGFVIDGLAIECWTVAGEEDIERMERVMTTFVDALRKAEVAMPENIYRVEECKASAHAHCHVYRFGSRRLHVATRVTDAGRILLVVRCGGGFVDFVEFARRHGSLENVRMQKRREDGRDVVRLTSVLAKGKVRALPASRASNSSRPSSRRPSTGSPHGSVPRNSSIARRSSSPRASSPRHSASSPHNSTK